ncbi:MAG: hypothetical protein V5A34_08565 [Halapricum sp.]
MSGLAELRNASTVLIQNPGIEDAGDSGCMTSLLDPELGIDRAVIVTVALSPSEWERRLARQATGQLPPVDYIDVQTLSGSASASDSADAPTPVATVPSPADLVTLGETIHELLNDAAEDGDRIGLSIHSVLDMLQFVDREFLFKFLHLVGDRLRNVDAIGFYHLDSTVPEQLRVTLAHLCDTIVECDGEKIDISDGYYEPTK